jgi:hypothetical protein
MIDLKGKIWVDFGLRESGKSTFADHVLTTFGKQGLYYDTVHESPENSNYDIYQPKNRYSISELETVIKAITPVKINDLPKYRMFVIDESNRFCPSKPSPLPQRVADLNDQCRHYLMSVGFVARRPCQLNQDLTELADYIFLFHLTGKNDLSYLDSLKQGLGDAVETLTNHQFIVLYPDRHYELMEAIKPNEIWIKKAKKLIDR